MKFLPGRLTPCYWHDGQLTFLATWKVWWTTRRGTAEKIYFRFWDLNRSSGLSNNFPRITRTYLWQRRKGIVWCSQTWSQARSCQAIIKTSMKTSSNCLMTGKHPLWPDDSFFFTKQQWAQESRTPNSPNSRNLLLTEKHLELLGGYQLKKTPCILPVKLYHYNRTK